MRTLGYIAVFVVAWLAVAVGTGKWLEYQRLRWFSGDGE